MDEEDESRVVLWPLHPRPRGYETLDRWVMRIAAAYGIAYTHFCRSALGLRCEEMPRMYHDPPDHVLVALAAGTDIPLHALRRMTIGPQFSRWIAEAEGVLRNEEAEWGRWLSQQGREKIWWHWHKPTAEQREVYERQWAALAQWYPTIWGRPWPQSDRRTEPFEFQSRSVPTRQP